MAKPTEMHMQVAKRILRYLRGTTELGIYYQKGENGKELKAYTDSDYAGDTNDMKSISGDVFLLSAGAIAWCSKKQLIVTLSSTEAEFIALSKNPIMHGRSKHIDIRFHFLRDLTMEGVISLSFCGTADQIADIMTKPLKTDTFLKLRSALGMCEATQIS
ncbi:hypothetical protein LIER_07634 [Lithospermum erythrorhizon]|uniref:Uncharacterized protein n=1 Tax=Lithospermum erythrorhizon TaxID=34254 RepID=A0AAV3P8S8_LITER